MNTIKDLTDSQLGRLVDVFVDLSPENLTCDGELSNDQVKRRHKVLMNQLEGLQAEFALAPVEEADVFEEAHQRECAVAALGVWILATN